MDTARTLGDIQNKDFYTSFLFCLTVEKEPKDELEKTKIDEMFFGNNLAETLKSAKTISKSVADLRIATTFKSTAAQKPAKPLIRSLNARTAPASRKPPASGSRIRRAAQPVPTS